MSTLPPSTLRIKRGRDETPVATLFVPINSSKRLKTDSEQNPTYIFRLAQKTTPKSPGGPTIPEVVDEDAKYPGNSHNRKIAPIRRYQLSKKARLQPYSHGAMFERVKDVEMEDAEPIVAQPQQPQQIRERKRPRTHPREREMFKQRDVVLEDAALSREQELEMERIMAYLEETTRDLPPTPAHQETDDDGDLYVYDVYERVELPAGAELEKEKEKGGEYGEIVFADSDDEEWWHEGADEDDNHSDKNVCDDTDSNCEGSDYPEEEEDDSEDEFAGYNLREGDYDEDDYDGPNYSDEDNYDASDDEIDVPDWRKTVMRIGKSHSRRAM
ncbi:hypothetical protein BZA77DRAFT_389255 [Pyronema omphalodes]|nr:hypothetical protein BZA77DRAFT_389255 [Pyronema omphalodes]